MKYSIHVTQAAERDMANAYDYIDLVLKNQTAADKLLDVADEKIGALAELFCPTMTQLLISLQRCSTRSFSTSFFVWQIPRRNTTVRCRFMCG